MLVIDGEPLLELLFLLFYELIFVLDLQLSVHGYLVNLLVEFLSHDTVQGVRFFESHNAIVFLESFLNRGSYSFLNLIYKLRKVVSK